MKDISNEKEVNGRIKIKGTLCYIECSADNNKIIMIYRNSNPKDIHYRKFVGVGGGQEEGEGSLECVLREMKEETGIPMENFIIERKGTVLYNNEGRTFNGKPAKFDYECVVYWAKTDKLPRCSTDKRDLIVLKDKRDIPFLPSHPCDPQIYLLATSENDKEFHVEVIHKGTELSKMIIKYI